MRWKTLIIWITFAAIAAGIATVLIVRTRRWDSIHLTIQGAVLRSDADTRKELPIADALVTVTQGAITIHAQSDASGYFKATFPEVVWPGQIVSLTFQHPDYKPLGISEQIQFRSTGKKLIVAAMTPEPATPHLSVESGKALTTVTSIRVRYTENFQTEENIGSEVKTFQVVNQGNVPCRRQAPCSPDRYWKAATASETLDAGPGNEFRNVRASCMAGPCPFTQIDSSGFIHGGRVVVATATDWSDTATFLFEAEVFHTTIGSNVRHLYPVTFGQTLNFTLPPTQEGVSIEAEVNGTPMVFPLGPDLYLSWATCSARTIADADRSTVYRCELKPGFRF